MNSLLENASREWRASLIDVGGSNRLLHYRDTGTTLDLADAPEAAVGKLLGASPVRLNELFPDPESLKNAQKACAGLARKQQEAVEEYGVSIAYLAAGLCEWETGETSPPRAPMLLRGVQLTRRRGVKESWELRLADELQVNAVLVHVLNSDRERIDDDAVLDLDTGGLGGLDAMIDAVAAACADVPGFRVQPALVLGAFSYAKQTMVDDVSDLAALGASDVASALAGDLDAAVRVRASGTGRRGGDAPPLAEDSPDYDPVETDYLVLDADASQSFVVNAALEGRHLVVEGPPGTGKSQTIANLIATAVASGRSVLFVAQKRAAISAVLDRLQRVDLGHLVLDLFASSTSRRHVADQLQTALDRQSSAGEPRVDELHYTLTRARDLLVRHKDALHSPTRAWGTSISDMIALALATPPGTQSDVRILTSELASWDGLEAARVRLELQELERIGALEADWSTTPGWSPAAIISEEALRRYGGLAQRLLADLPLLERALATIAASEPGSAPADWTSVDALLAIYAEADRIADLASASLGTPPTTAELRNAGLAIDRRARTEARATTGERMRGSARRASARLAKTLVGHLPRSERAVTLWAAADLRASWPGAPGDFSAPAGWTDAAAELRKARAALAELDEALTGVQLSVVPLDELGPRLRALAADQRRAVMPRAHEQRSRLEALGLGDLLAELERRPDVTRTRPGQAAAVFDRVVSSSVLDEALLYDSHLAGTTGAELGAATTAFQRDDLDHLSANAVRIRRLAAERLKAALDGNPEQHLRLKTEVTRKTRFTPVRRLVAELPDALLAAKPVWAMSPLQVSRLLPARAVFDLVVFDEASQVKPADAIPSILRGRTLVVAGDSRQLPPTEFFSKTLDEPEPEPEPESEEGVLTETDRATATATALPDAPSRGVPSLTRDAESILFAMDRLLAGRSRRLLWHYRSRDERLIAVSNAEIYDRALTTFPAADTPDAIRHIQVPPSPGIAGGTNSPEGEVAAVVAAVTAHAREHPDESLGVIAFGVKHQNRLEAALGAAFDADPELAAVLDAHPGEPFFVKAVERVQGDERDAVILSVGYGPSPDGAIRLFWGPLLQPGGERRLNVAISRARLRMTLVTSFGADQLREDAHDSRGYRLMYRFVQFMASGGAASGVGASGAPGTRSDGPNAFERDVHERLSAAGLPLDVRVGVGSYRIDLAARHPSIVGRHVLALETDGSSYSSGHTARERDRLRQQLLERRGWAFHRIWSTDWLADPEAQIAAAVAAYEAAVERADRSAVLGGAVPMVAAGVPAAWELPVGERRLPRPEVAAGSPIDDYRDAQLQELVRWIRSDDVVRSADDELSMAIAELGFARRGPKIVSRLQEAQARAELG